MVVKGLKERVEYLKDIISRLSDNTEKWGSGLVNARGELALIEETLKTLVANEFGANIKLVDKNDPKSLSRMIEFLTKYAKMSDEIAASTIDRLKNMSSEEQTHELRILILEKEVKARAELLDIAESEYRLVRAKVEFSEKTYTTLWKNLKTQQTLLSEHYKGLQTLANKLSGHFADQKLSITNTNTLLGIQSKLIEDMEKTIKSKANTTHKFTQEFLQARVHIGMSSDEIENLAKELGVSEVYMGETVRALKALNDAAEENLSIQYRITRQKELQSNIENTINDAYNLRISSTGKYFSILEDLYKSAGAREEDLYDIKIRALDEEIRMLQKKAQIDSKIVYIQDVLGASIEKTADDSIDSIYDMNIANKENEKQWLQVQKNLLIVKKTLGDMHSVTERFAGLLSSVVFDATSDVVDNLQKAHDIEEDMADQQNEIAKLQRDLSNATDPSDQAKITYDLMLARKEYEKLNVKANEYKSVLYNIAMIGKNLAEGLSDIIIEINKEQLKESLKELITNTPFEARLANTLSGGLIEASKSGSVDYYTNILEGARQGAEIIYTRMTNAAIEASTALASVFRQAMVGTAATTENIIGANAASSSAPETNTALNNLNNTIVELARISTFLNETLTQLNISLQTGLATKLPKGVSIPKPPKPGEAPEFTRRERLDQAFKALTAQLSMMAGTYIGAQAGGAQGAMLGSSILGSVGSELGSWGTIAGSILGGILGGIIEGEEEIDTKPLEPQILNATTDNTEALEATTVSLNKLSVAINDIRQEMINAPSRFIMPPQMYGGFLSGGGGGFSVLIQVNGSMDANVGRQITNDINAIYKNQYRRQGYSTRLI